MSKSFVFYVNNMKCAHCRSSLEQSLKESNSIKLVNLAVDVTTEDPKRTIVIIEEDSRDSYLIWNEIKQLIEKKGFTCEPYNYLQDEENESPKELHAEQSPVSNRFTLLIDNVYKIFSSHWFLGALGCIIGLTMLITSITLGGLPLTVLIPLAGVSTLLTLLLGANSYYDAFQKLIKARALTMDTLFSISTLSVLIVSISAFFIPWLPMMFEAGLLIYGFRHIGIAIEETIKGKISSAKFQDRVPKLVNLLIDNKEVSIKLKQVKPQDTIIVKPGEVIPLDGICLEKSSIYKTIFMGTTLPEDFKKGDIVLAGMKLAENAPPLKIKVTRDAQHSYPARLDEGIAQSILEKAPLEVKTNQILNWFIPSILAISIFSGVVVGLFFPPAIAIQCAISVLVSACPCTLGLIIPLAVKTGMQKAAELGIQFNNAKTLQATEQIDTVIFDLNGTLTTGVYTVEQFVMTNKSGLTSHQLLGICSALEQNTNHPIGKAIHQYASLKCPPQYQLTSIDNSNHSGITGVINNKKYAIGNQTFMQNLNISTPDSSLILNLQAGDSIIYIAEEDKLLGYIIITDPIRKDAKETIQTLNKMGKTIHLCTGADHETALRYAKELNIAHVRANCLATSIHKEDQPKDTSSSDEEDNTKPNYIKSLMNQNHKVAMIGDSGNDAHALATSDVGFAIISKHSDELTQNNAGVIINDNSLLLIPAAIEISKQTVGNSKQNLLISMGYNLATVFIAGGLLVGIGITLNPAVGVALMAIQACIILLNVYRFKTQPLEEVRLEHHLSPSSSNQISESLGLDYSHKSELCSETRPGKDPHFIGIELWKSSTNSKSAIAQDQPFEFEIENKVN